MNFLCSVKVNITRDVDNSRKSGSTGNWELNVEKRLGEPAKENLFGGTSHLHPFAPRNLLDRSVLQDFYYGYPKSYSCWRKKM